MHVPDGFINAPVSVAAGVVAAGAVAVSLRGARRELDERIAPLAGLVAAFIFAVQMLNFPVAAGTSGHLLGGALAAILVGPYTGVLCVSVVLLMQGILFADGGLTALGVNITVMAVVTTVVGYAVFRGLVKVLPRKRRSVTVSAFVAAALSVPAAALVFTLVYAIGGTTDVPIGRVLTAMVGVHVLIGLGEAAITAFTVGAVIAVRPDLVHGARGLRQKLQLRVGGELVDAAPEPQLTPAPARRTRTVWLTGLAASLVLAGVVSFYASASPDGLEKVAADKGIDAKAEAHAAADSPLADYGVEGITDGRLSGGLAGVIGVGATIAAGTGVFWAVRRRRTDEDSPAVTPARASEVGAGHAHRLYRRAHSPVHALPPHTKLAAAFAFVIVVVSTPREAVWAFAVYAVLLAAVARAAQVPAVFLLKRLLIEVPFVAFAVLMPFVAQGERVEVLGMSLSVNGLWGAWNVLAKGTLGVATSVLLASTTELRELLLGLQRLRLPPLLVQIASFMIRYGDVITDEMRRMRIARESRGFEARGVRHWGCWRSPPERCSSGRTSGASAYIWP